jgi:hypothetical protein
MRGFPPICFFFFAITAFVWSVQHDPFFWDTVQLASKHAHFFYENGLRWAALPTDIDSGHPPALGFYLATVWHFLGKNLPASHWAMLPFLLLNAWLLYRLGRRLGGEVWAFWLLPLALLDPVVLGQSALVSPDVALLSFLLLAIEGILGARTMFVALGILGLCAVSMRGMMTAAGLAAWATFLALQRARDLRSIVVAGLPFLPGFVLAAWFLCWHHDATGWVGFHAGSPWARAFERASGAVFLKNILVVGWRFVDFGRVAEWAILAWLLWRGRAFWAKSPLLALFICLGIFLLPSALLYRNLSAHRYLLPLFAAFHLLVFQWIVQSPPQFWGKIGAGGVLALLAVSLALGNLWIYPRGISMDWDSTLAHRPYHDLRAEAVAFLEEKKVDFQTVGSAFPNLNTGEHLLLNGDQRRFADKDFSHNRYIFASNIFNDFSESDYDILHRDWVLIWQKKRAGVWVEIYTKR